MPDTIAVRPAKDRSVRNPDRKFRLLQADGELVPANAFWLRRVAAGDVVEIAPDDWKKLLDDRRDAAEKAEADAKALEKAEATSVPTSPPEPQPSTPPAPVTSSEHAGE